MSIFRRETPPASPVPGGASEAAPSSQKRRLTHIAAGTRLQGAVTGATELLIDGEVAGEVRIDAPVTVGAEGVVTGPIVAPLVRICGRVVGDVKASDRVEVSPSGSLEGNISAPRVVIAEGAFFKGVMDMRGDKSPGGRGPAREG
jgi:cytoskeletal protein CcmA (bactofilin family)